MKELLVNLTSILVLLMFALSPRFWMCTLLLYVWNTWNHQTLTQMTKDKPGSGSSKNFRFP